jgi:hypothetical protein
MASSQRSIIGGVDTHTATHHAAVIDLNGRLIADAEFPPHPPEMDGAAVAVDMSGQREESMLISLAVRSTWAILTERSTSFCPAIRISRGVGRRHLRKSWRAPPMGKLR